jgi:hypothetical protein
MEIEEHCISAAEIQERCILAIDIQEQGISAVEIQEHCTSTMEIQEQSMSAVECRSLSSGYGNTAVDLTASGINKCFACKCWFNEDICINTNATKVL